MATIKQILKLSDLGLSKEFIHELILKMIYVQGAISGKEISNLMKVSFGILEEEFIDLKKRDLVGVIGSVSGIGGYSSMIFDLTPKGRDRAGEIFNVRPYVGPTPVCLTDYIEVIDQKKINTRKIDEQKLKSVFGDMILNQNYFSKIGPAINSGGPILFFGEPGNGKTMIAEKVINSFDDYIYVPYCLMIDGQFIKYFDEKVHIPISYDTTDPRWIKVQRPFVVVGGELTLPMLDLIYKSEFKYYEAPAQLKANGGVFLIDDFGRQLVSPTELLNRWIYPLEKKTDYLTLVTGKKIEVPFNQMLLFSSNLKPQDLGDDAFLRRIKYKIEITSPTVNEFNELFKGQCVKLNIKYNDEAFKYLVQHYFIKEKRDVRGCHARDLLSHIVDFNSFYNKPNKLSKESIDFACNSYFSKFK
ncbi:hypothetical protein [Bacteriovorax sp. Seq25_V]|uniref:hypothetical protein n=1 Tax=Bacteriovorax sp. Seq25_V TaxID=1201288 RepID=UPI000389EF07|nr:hypothetical protein [Bacteriovorax sp. Seq25_V]EQC44257.1 hypothetical protein M900_A0395 [Bacteriovorax sp. Seq25_V]